MSVFAELSPPYSTIVADPPWHYGARFSMAGGNRPDGPPIVRPMTYSTMTVGDVCALPVGALAAGDSFLFLWTTNAYLPHSFAVMESWGFRYRQTLVWRKTGNPTPFGGSLAPNHAEYLIVASRGNPRVGGRLASTVIEAPKPYQHSRKPETFMDAIETVAPGPYVELFARTPRLGWDSWGHGYEGRAA